MVTAVVSLKNDLFSVRYRYNNGQYAKNAFIKDNDGNVYYFDNTGRMAIGEKTIDGKQYFFLANGCNCVMVTVKTVEVKSSTMMKTVS